MLDFRKLPDHHPFIFRSVHGIAILYAESVEVCLIGSYDNLTQKIYEYLEEADYINITVYETGERVA